MLCYVIMCYVIFFMLLCVMLFMCYSYMQCLESSGPTPRYLSGHTNRNNIKIKHRANSTLFSPASRCINLKQCQRKLPLCRLGLHASSTAK